MWHKSKLKKEAVKIQNRKNYESEELDVAAARYQNSLFVFVVEDLAKELLIKHDDFYLN